MSFTRLNFSRKVVSKSSLRGTTCPIEEISQLIEALGQRKDLDLTERIFQLTNWLNAKKK